MKSQQWKTAIAIVLATFLQISLKIESISLAQDNELVGLPGQPKVGFKQYSGYITTDQKPQRALFYYFVEAETEPALKPLVLWLNGGPGCSSFGAGALLEHGPFRPNGKTLEKNEYSWNREANMLYLESPAGVGFSFSANRSFYSSLSDELTARDNLQFLQRWFLKFPEYKKRDFYIAGESYAGHYVPQLAQLVVQSNLKLNLKGIAIGNPLLEFTTDMNAVDHYYWSHGLISDTAYELTTLLCNNSRLMSEAISGFFTADCVAVYSEVSTEITKSINKYDVIADVCLLPKLSILSHPLWSRFHQFPSLHSQENALHQQQVSEKADVCAEQKIDEYLNRKDVQEALHAQLVGTTKWSLCNNVVQYMGNLEMPTIQVVGSLVKAGIRVMVYSGDQDSVIPFTGTRTLVYKLAKELGLKTTEPYRAWFERKQVGGWTQVYGNILSYAIIRGASHTAPSTQPERSLVLFKAFLEGKPLPES